MGDRAAKNALFDQFARVGKALASGKRLELLDLLAQGERTVDALARAGELGLTTASAHLQTLKAANLVTTRRDGTKVYYRLAGIDVAQLLALMRAVASTHLPDVEAAASAYLSRHRRSHPGPIAPTECIAGRSPSSMCARARNTTPATSPAPGPSP